MLKNSGDGARDDLHAAEDTLLRIKAHLINREKQFYWDVPQCSYQTALPSGTINRR